MLPISASLHRRTPNVQVLDNRGYFARDIRYHRHPDTLNMTDECISRHQYDVRGHLVSSIDPRLYEAMQQGADVKTNFRYQTALSGEGLKTESVDAGTTMILKDALGRPAISQNAEGVITRWHYETEGAGRLLYVSEKAPGENENITARFVYAQDTPDNRAHNLVGSFIAHYDSAGVKRTEAVSLTGVVLSVTQQLLKDNEEASWQGEAEDGEIALDETCYQTTATADAVGAMLTQTDAKGNVQRHSYDIAGMLKSSNLTLKGESSATPLFKQVTYSASGQKQQETHGNGLISTYTYAPENQRLIGIKVERPANHAKGAKLFQDLHYTYDPVGNVLSVENRAEKTRFFRNKKIVPKNTYRYDTLYQLVTATGREMVSASGTQLILPEPISPISDNTQYSTYTRDYDYDRGGNLTKIRHHAPPTGKQHTTEVMVSDKSNRAVLKTAGLIPEQVDTLFHPGGHQKELIKGQGLTWTQRGELASVKMTGVDTETYRYDAASQRVTKITTRQHSGSLHSEKVIYLGNLEIRTRHQEGKLKEELHRINAGNIQFLHWETGNPEGIDNNQQRHSHGDIINSCGLELDQHGELISQEEYYPYGGTSIWTTRSKTEADYKTLRYSGKERDATGLYYYGYRYYQSWLGRWLSIDPAGTVDGLNLYRMVRNNPVRWKDEVGLVIFEKVSGKKREAFLDEIEKNAKMFLSAVHLADEERINMTMDYLFDYKENEQIEGIMEKIKKIEHRILNTNYRERIQVYTYTLEESDVPGEYMSFLSEFHPEGFYLSDSFNRDNVPRNEAVSEEGKYVFLNYEAMMKDKESGRVTTLFHELAHDMQNDGLEAYDFIYGYDDINILSKFSRGEISESERIKNLNVAYPRGLPEARKNKTIYQVANEENADTLAYTIKFLAYTTVTLPVTNEKIMNFGSKHQDAVYYEALIKSNEYKLI